MRVPIVASLSVLVALAGTPRGQAAAPTAANASPAPHVHLSARIDGRDRPERALVGRTGLDGRVVDLALEALARCDDVPRMVLVTDDIRRLEREDHLSLSLDPPPRVALAIPNYGVRVSDLVVPLAQARTAPDWLFYCRSTPSERAAWGVYRWRGADPAVADKLRAAVRAM